MSMRKFMTYAAAPVSFHVFTFGVSMAELALAKSYGGETCASPLTVFLLVTGVHSMVCSILGLLDHAGYSTGSKGEESQDETRKSARPAGSNESESTIVRNNMSESEAERKSVAESLANSVKFDESIETNPFLKKKGKGKKKGGKKGEDQNDDMLSLIGDSAVKIMDWLFRFSWLVAGSTWVYSTNANMCDTELYWGTYVFVSVGWVNFLVTLIATATSLVYAMNSKDK